MKPQDNLLNFLNFEGASANEKAEENKKVAAAAPGRSQTSSTEKASSEKINWDIKPIAPIMEYDELPDDQEINTQAVSHSTSNLLADSITVIANIAEYCKTMNVPTIKDEPTKNQQVFTHDNIKYLLEDEKHLMEIYHIILDLNKTEKVQKTLERRPHILRDLLADTKNSGEQLKHTIFSKISGETRNILVERVMSIYLTKQLQASLEESTVTLKEKGFDPSRLNKKGLEVEFNANILSHNIGSVLFENYMLTKYIYALEPDTTMDLKTPNLIKLSEQLKTIDVKKEPLAEYAIIYLQNYIYCNQTIEDKNNNYQETSPTQKHSISKLYYSIGADVINWLIELEILKSKQKQNSNATPTLLLTKNHYFELMAPASYQRPPLSPTLRTPQYPIKVTDTTIIDFGLDYKIIPNDKSVRIVPNPELYDLIKELEKTPMKVDAEVYEYVISLLEEVNLHYVNNSSLNLKEDEIVQAFIKLIYDIDFKLFFENDSLGKPKNNDHALCIRLVQFALDLKTHYDFEIRDSCKTNVACLEAYNKISSYKYYIKGLLNDVNIYRHFSQFFIPYYITNTGRIYAKPYFLQLD
jgi:hypothetical protein